MFAPSVESYPITANSGREGSEMLCVAVVLGVTPLAISLSPPSPAGTAFVAPLIVYTPLVQGAGL